MSTATAQQQRTSVNCRCGSALRPMSLPSTLLEGFLQKQSGGLFLKKKQKWAVLKSDGTLSLSKKPELPPSRVVHMYELDDVQYNEEDCSISFSSVHNGSILKAYKFFALETPTFEEWVEALDKMRKDPGPDYAKERSRYIRETMSILDSIPTREVAASTLTDEELEKSVDPVLLIQSSGEPVAKTGYIKKRGGAYGGNTSYKKRYFVLTMFGRVVYFADQKKTRALGQFSLVNATIQHIQKLEASVVTPTRVWFLKFESESNRLEWIEKLETIMALVNSTPPAKEDKDKEENSGPQRRFRRNVSLLRQRSNLDGIGFSTLEPQTSEDSTDDKLTTDSLSVACVTWNLSENLPKMQQIRFLRKFRKHQVIVVGVQECQSVMYHSFSSRQLSPLDIWLAMVKSVVGDTFTLVASRSMGAIHLCVFVRQEIIGCISDVNATFVPCGLGNVMHNKGAVAIVMKVNQTSCCFVCAHLAASQEKTIERNQDFHRISHFVVENLGKAATHKALPIIVEENKTRAGLFIVDNGEYASHEDESVFQCAHQGAAKGAHTAHVDSLDMLAREFDRCFFLGDLNYRIDAGKEWVERHLSMAEMMRQQEKEENLTQMKEAQNSKEDEVFASHGNDGLDADPELELDEGPMAKKVEELLNLIQVGDYGTDDEDDEDDDDDTVHEVSSGERSVSHSSAGEVLKMTNDMDQCAIDSKDKENPQQDKDKTIADKNVALKHFQDETKFMTSSRVYEFLLTYDQLFREMGKDTVFRGFVEGPIHFKPSYKFDPFTEVYDTSKKSRVPAWCDRVLYTPSGITLDHYRCIHGKFHSDHRAVVAIFTVKV